MKQRNWLKLFILLFYAVSCNSRQSAATTTNTINDSVPLNAAPTHDTFTVSKVIPAITCKNDAAQSYALYIPSQNENQKLPVIYFFDPHANGALPLYKYKALADKYGFILVGSNNSKNGNDLSMAENIWNTVSVDVLNRVNINKERIYTCGFSGGAKVAGYIALHHSEVKGIIANSAAMPDGTMPGNFNFSYTGIAGDGDMNMTEVVSFCNALDNTTTHHHLLLFNGKHEWAPETTMNTAFEGLMLDAMHNKQVSFNSGFIKNYTDESIKKVEGFIALNDYIKAVRECKLSTSLLDGLAETTVFKSKQNGILNNSLYKNQLQQQQELFIKEEETKKLYQQQFQTADNNYWATTINDLNTKAKAKTAEGAMYNRLLAYLSLAFYSISNNFINSNQNEGAKYFVSLYKMADPANSDAWYFSAILNARNNNSKAAEDDLMKAAQYGFSDTQRMLQQPDFKAVSTPINFAAVESKMNAASY